MMPLWLSVVLFVAFCAAVAVVLFHHKHRWTAWSDRTVTRDGRMIIQARRCKDAACNLQQIKDITP